MNILDILNLLKWVTIHSNFIHLFHLGDFAKNGAGGGVRYYLPVKVGISSQELVAMDGLEPSTSAL